MRDYSHGDTNMEDLGMVGTALNRDNLLKPPMMQHPHMHPSKKNPRDFHMLPDMTSGMRGGRIWIMILISLIIPAYALCRR